MSVMLCARTIPTAPRREVRESWVDRLLAVIRRPSREALIHDAYASGKHVGRLLAWDLYRPLVEAAKAGDLSLEQLAAVARFIDERATEKLNPGAR